LRWDEEEDSPALPTTFSTPESLLIERSGHAAVQCAIEQLPVIFREVILLRDVEDASCREIAEILSPDRNPYVTSGQSPEGSSRITP
jgi:DNA-directed RNA polymerase specialized sigma24 family protein